METKLKLFNEKSVRLSAEGSELVTFCHQLKMQSTTGEVYERITNGTQTAL